VCGARARSLCSFLGLGYGLCMYLYMFGAHLYGTRNDGKTRPT
jgi:hypothetical protein